MHLYGVSPYTLCARKCVRWMLAAVDERLGITKELISGVARYTILFQVESVQD